MAYAEGINKVVSFKKQVALGTPATGSGGQKLRRETATFNSPKDSYSPNEINSHQQHTGDTHGIVKPQGSLSGVLSPGTYSDFFASVLRKAFAATSSITGLTLTIAADGDNWSVTRSAGDYLGAAKIGDVVRLDGANLDAANKGVNLLVLNVTATALTVATLNGDVLTAEAAKASSSVTFPGKKSLAPLAGHTNDWFTIEEWFADISKSRLYSDMKPGSVQVGLPSSGNATVQIPFMGIKSTKGDAQVLTTPTDETTTPILNATNGYVLLGGGRIAIATSASLTIDRQIQHGEGTIGSKFVSGLTHGDLKVSGSFTQLYADETEAFDDETATSLIFVVTDNAERDSAFVTFVIPALKILTDDTDDGKKQIIKTNNFTAQIHGAGGAALATDKTTISIQDSSLV